MMIIKSIMIDGFGHFHDASLENLPGGLVIISGDNEAGKSTLLGFIRTILFGFPTARANENLYQPLAGGQHGGRITVLTESQGEVIIERMAGRRGGPVNLLFTRNGTRGSEEELKHLLRGFNRTIYKNIYAFSLEELQTFDSLNDEDVRGALYGVGAGTSLTAIPTSMKKLEKNIEILFKPRGSTPLINEKLTKLEETRKELRTAAGEIKTYEDLVHNLQETGRQIEDLKKEEKSYQTKQHRIESYLKPWDQWIILQETEAALNRLPIIVTQFPDDGWIRLKTLNENLASSEKSLARKENEIAGLNTKLGNLVIDELLIANDGEISGLKDNLKIYTTNIRELPGDQSYLEQKRKDIHRELANLGSNWTEKRVYSIDRSLFTKDAIQQYRERQQTAESELEKTKDELFRNKKEYEISQDKEEAINKELQGFHDLKPQKDKKLISAIQDGKQQFASLNKELPKRCKELKDESDELENTIKEIDPHWNITAVESFDCSVPAREKIQTFEDRFSEAKKNIFEQEKKLEFQESNLADIQKERLLHEQNSTQKSNHRNLKWWAIILLTMGIIIIGTGGIMIERLLEGCIIGSIFIILALFVFIIFRERRLSRTSLERKLQEDLDEIIKKEVGIKETIKKINENLRSSQEALRQVQHQWEQYLKGLSLNPEIKPGTVNLIFSKVEGIKNSIRNINTLKERIKEMETENHEYRRICDRIPELSGKISIGSTQPLSIIEGFLEQNKNMEERRQERSNIAQKLAEQKENSKILEEKLNEDDQRYREAVKQQEQVHEEWRAWLSKSGLDPGISPETALSAMITINTCIQLIDTKTELEKSIKQKEKQVEQYRVSVETIFAKISRTKPALDSISTNIQLIYDEMNKSKLDLENRKNLEEQLTNASIEMKTLDKDIESYKKEIEKLLREGGAGDEETFRTRGELFKKKQEFLAGKENAERNMKIISGIISIDELKGILNPYSKEKLEEENRDLQQKIEGIDKNLEKAQAELGKTNNQIENLSSSDEISRLRAREEKLKEEIRVNAKIWGANAIARYLVIKAREKFEKERQPKVIKEASRFFDTFTGGEYKEIIAPLGEQSIEVITSMGKRKKPGQLSRATAEQLFLSLRFGYMTNYAESSEGLPVIMDDILVNFDPTRSYHTARTIFELAETHQVLFFTCHPEMISIFKKQKADAPVYYIKGGKFVYNGDI
jgi:uncharacterized protein YhaN